MILISPAKSDTIDLDANQTVVRTGTAGGVQTSNGDIHKGSLGIDYKSGDIYMQTGGNQDSVFTDSTGRQKIGQFITVDNVNVEIANELDNRLTVIEGEERVIVNRYEQDYITQNITQRFDEQVYNDIADNRKTLKMHSYQIQQLQADVNHLYGAVAASSAMAAISFSHIKDKKIMLGGGIANYSGYYGLAFKLQAVKRNIQFGIGVSASDEDNFNDKITAVNFAAGF